MAEGASAAESAKTTSECREAARPCPPNPQYGRRNSIPRRSLLIMAGVAAVFLAVRVPLMYRQCGGNDEDWFSVPGWTVAHEGIPRVPYAPSRDPRCAFYRVDEAMFGLPPAYFYWQAPFFLALPDGYGTARLASGVAGLIAVWLVYRLGRAFYQDEATGLWAAGLYSVSRVFYFPAQTARPDTLCATLGLAALLAAWHWRTSGRLRYVVGAGVLVGLGALAHPFAIVYALQVGFWLLISGRGIRGRLGPAAVLVACTLAVLCLWLPLILAYPEAFRGQFFTNVLDRAGPGIAHRFLHPWPWMVHHAEIVLELALPIQFAAMFLGLLGATLIDLRRRYEPEPVSMLALAWSGLYFLAVCQGPHSIKGYWCYPGALLFLGVGRTVMVASRRAAAFVPRPLWWAGVTAAALLVMVPGSGIRTWVAHLEHWSDINYNAPRFADRMFRDLPRDARLTVDPAYVLDAFLDGRKTTLGVTEWFFFRSMDFPYDYLIVGRRGIDKHVAEQLNGEFIRAYGDRDDIFACYAELYQPKRAAGAEARYDR
ncbi:MAG: glycosyltransferase family 39 protein [Pirellulales bacterium]|nr:glycosyltransferase family 39 protein [Pirellulales bacterium]